jgi:hypothetical protein
MNLKALREAFLAFIAKDMGGTYNVEFSKSTQSFVNASTQSMWLAWRACRKLTLDEHGITEPEEDTGELAREFLKDNLRDIATERFNRTPYSMPKNALFLQAARLYATHRDLDSDEAIDAVEDELKDQCLLYVKENLK